MKIKVSEASGCVLDWMVATHADKHVNLGDIHWGNYKPSTNWAQGGPIIEREGISTWHDEGNGEWDASMLKGRFVESGPTPLIGAMRCYCASRLGEIVEVPDELA